jgi:hypothetical protein
MAKNQSETLGEYACVIVNTRYIPVQTNEEKKKSELGLYFLIKGRKEEND